MIANSLIAAAFTPQYLQFPYAWVGHVPVAAWLIQALPPKIFVELGADSGNAYFAFCQSVAKTNLPTQCYGVDTWAGDRQADYDEGGFARVNQYQQENDGRFSQLLRMSFSVRFVDISSTDQP